MLKFTKRLRSNEDGATAIEYGLLAALIAVALIVTLNVLSGSLQDTFTAVSTELDTANTPAGGGGGGGGGGGQD